MSLFTSEILTSGAGVLASVGAALAGLVRFHAWWRDRARQRRIESATYFKEKGSAEWQKAFGEEQLIRANFAALTGIDRSTGHEAMIRCHSRLGGRDEDWETLRGVGHFLVVTGHVARVRKLGHLDILRLLSAGCMAVLSVVLSIGMMFWAVTIATKTDWSALRFIDGVAILIAVAYASMFALFGLILSRHCVTYFNARFLYRQMIKAGKARRKTQVQQRLSLPEDLQLVEISRRSDSGGKPYLVSTER